MAKQQKADSGAGQNGHEEEVARYEQELAAYLQERIKPGLNSGAIPLVARSIAKAIAHRERPKGASEDAAVDDEPSADADDEPSADADDEPSADADDEPTAEADDEPTAEADDEPSAEADDEPSAEADDEPSAEADDEPTAEADDEPTAEADDEPTAEADDEPSAESEAPPDFEADMHELQAQLGEDWILRFSVQGEEGWLTAEKDDGSQRLEAQTAAVLLEAVELLNENGRPVHLNAAPPQGMALNPGTARVAGRIAVDAHACRLALPPARFRRAAFARHQRPLHQTIRSAAEGSRFRLAPSARAGSAARRQCRPCGRWSPRRRPPNRTCDFHRIRLSMSTRSGSFHASACWTRSSDSCSWWPARSTRRPLGSAVAGIVHGLGIRAPR